MGADSDKSSPALQWINSGWLASFTLTWGLHHSFSTSDWSAVNSLFGQSSLGKPRNFCLCFHLSVKCSASIELFTDVSPMRGVWIALEFSGLTVDPPHIAKTWLSWNIFVFLQWWTDQAWLPVLLLIALDKRQSGVLNVPLLILLQWSLCWKNCFLSATLCMHMIQRLHQVHLRKCTMPGRQGLFFSFFPKQIDLIRFKRNVPFRLIFI